MTSPNYSTFDVRDARTTKNRARIVALENATAEQTQVEDDVYTDINDHIRARNLERKSKIQACIAAFVMFIPSYVASYLYLQERNKWIIFWTLIHFPAPHSMHVFRSIEVVIRLCFCHVVLDVALLNQDFPSHT
ncbi:hypothetical protein HBH56_174040 [Parastagonospora nodorum]|nr:hypothetical protein HBH56_174040 [Parastagonospora nodorum]KAH4007746.1 hypothetical protein HBI10_008060 [Parastagonospora nodorum]KAH4023539.1 hypothetical protein HBI13_089770 [Parastagonospora nodorum]KAH4082889.1 hypothetical protein HBH46_219540 [Parastagonospora nodorum]KAH4152107.1 hypothetical protein HBH44_162800 [Parastagonospora nodorum]